MEQEFSRQLDTTCQNDETGLSSVWVTRRGQGGASLSGINTYGCDVDVGTGTHTRCRLVCRLKTVVTVDGVDAIVDI